MSEHDKPVAWMDRDGCLWNTTTHPDSYTPLYTRPAQWVGLTDEDTALLDWESFKTKKECVQAIEALLREKNT